MRDFSIEQVVDLPGVGTNYMGKTPFPLSERVLFGLTRTFATDHVAEFLPFYGSEETDFIGPVLVGDDQAVEGKYCRWTSGPWTTPDHMRP